MQKKYKTGLVIGRFQPFHLGHEYLIDKALELADKIIIGIGSSNITDSNNPFDLSIRKEFLNEFISHAQIKHRVSKIVAIPDHPDDDEWFKLAEKETGPVDVVIGDNDWVNGIYERHKVPVISIGYYKRDILEGTKIRHHMRVNKPWQERVPQYLVSSIEKHKK